MLKTSVFQALMWKSDELCDVLVDFMNRMQETNPGYLLGITIDLDTVNGYQLYSDPDIVRMWVYRKKPGNLLHLSSDSKGTIKQKKSRL